MMPASSTSVVEEETTGAVGTIGGAAATKTKQTIHIHINITLVATAMNSAAERATRI